MVKGNIKEEFWVDDVAMEPKEIMRLVHRRNKRPHTLFKAMAMSFKHDYYHECDEEERFSWDLYRFAYGHRYRFR